MNIDLRLVDLQNLKRQQENSEHPDWSGLDPLDRHIRKLERSIDQVRIRRLLILVNTDYFISLSSESETEIFGMSLDWLLLSATTPTAGSASKAQHLADIDFSSICFPVSADLYWRILLF